MVLSNYRLDWKDELEYYPDMKLEYIPLDIAWKAALYSGMREHYPHFFAKSGSFAFFLFDLDRFWVYDLLRIVLVNNALSACNVSHAALNPENLDDAISFMDEMVSRGNLVWVSWMEPLLLYGVEGSEKNLLLHWHNPALAPEGTTWGRDELEQWWNWADFEDAHLLIAPTSITPGVNSEEDIAIELIKLAVQHFRLPRLDFGDSSIESGFYAYSKYAESLRNPDIDFLKKSKDGKMERTAWFCFAIYSQWTQTFAAHSYFCHIASIFTGEQRELLRKAAEQYSNAYGHWLEWHKIIGRHPDQQLYYSRIADMGKRIAAAEQVEAAAKDIEKAIEMLAELLEIRGVSLDEEQEESSNETKEN